MLYSLFITLLPITGGAHMIIRRGVGEGKTEGGGGGCEFFCCSPVFARFARVAGFFYGKMADC